MLGWRDITRASDMRTFVPSVLPTTAIGHKFPLAFPDDSAHGPLLHATWSSLAFDYVARQKLSGTGMTYFIVKQLACPNPATFAEPAPWQPDRSLAAWVRPYVLELSYTSWRLRPYAEELNDDGPPFQWDPERRSLLRADLDAAFLHVYGLTRPEAEHVLDSFFVVRKYEERDHGEFRTKRLVLDAYDRRITTATSATRSKASSAWTAGSSVPQRTAAALRPAISSVPTTSSCTSRGSARVPGRDRSVTCSPKASSRSTVLPTGRPGTASSISSANSIQTARTDWAAAPTRSCSPCTGATARSLQTACSPSRAPNSPRPRFSFTADRCR